jgi:hypothetical protein
MNKRSGIAGGVILILLGALFLASEIFPQVFQFWSWPFIIIGVGLVFILWAILGGIGGLAVPGTILSGLGTLFYFQVQSNNWASWSYAWALIPGFVGLGIILSGLIDRNIKGTLVSGLILMLISAIMFFAFGTAFGLEHGIARYWPVLLVVLGVISLVRALLPRKQPL